VQDVDPLDLKLWPTLRHLYPLWRAQWRLVLIGLSCALVFTGLSLAIPILIQRTIDNSIDGGDTALLLPYLGAITLIAAVRLGVNFTRRYSTARIGIAVEARLRGMMYDAYLRFPRAFYDRHATGEVISRATNDIYPVRYFIGWGVIQAIQSMMMLVGAAIVLTSVNARLTLYAALAMPPIAVRTSSRTRCSRSRGSCRRRRATSRRPRTRRSSGSRWCRRSAARTTSGSVSATVRRPSGPRRCDRRASRPASCPG
jgi:ABC-type multidrug transport system fused ATPase/permease subunit